MDWSKLNGKSDAEIKKAVDDYANERESKRTEPKSTLTEAFEELFNRLYNGES